MIMATIKVFLGTSASLMKMRVAIGDAVRQLSQQMEGQGVTVELLCWEDYKAEFTGDSKQLEYDRDLVLQSDIVFTVFKDKVGEYTKHELEVAKRDRKRIFCYTLRDKKQAKVEEVLTAMGVTSFQKDSQAEVIDSIVAEITNYAESYKGQSDMSSAYKNKVWFYATIPDDMKGYRTPFGNMMRSVDMTARHYLGTHCLLHPYSTPDNIERTNHYVALFKNVASPDDVIELQTAVAVCDAKKLEAISVFQQKPDRLDKKQGVKYDIRANCEAVRQIVDSRTIFTIGMQSLDRVRLQVLLWCLRKHSLSVTQDITPFSCQDGHVTFYGMPVADIASIEELKTLLPLSEEEETLSTELADMGKTHSVEIRKKSMRLRVLRAELLAKLTIALDTLMNPIEAADDYDSAEPVDCDDILMAEQTEFDAIETLSASSKERWKQDESRLRQRREYLQENAGTDTSLLIELRQVQDTLLQVTANLAKIGAITQMELLSEQIHAVAVYDTYLVDKIQCDIDPLYLQVIQTADNIGYTDPVIENMRLNWANAYLRRLQYQEGVEHLETAVAHYGRFEDDSVFVRLSICHLYMTTIDTYFALDFRSPRIKELLTTFAESVKRWEKSGDQEIYVYRAVLACANLRVIYGTDFYPDIIVAAEKAFDEAVTKGRLSPSDQYFGDVMCYLPNTISAYYLDRFDDFDPDEKASAFDKILYYTGKQIENADQLSRYDMMGSEEHLGKGYHHLGFLYAHYDDAANLCKAESYYQEAIKYRKGIFEQTDSPTDEEALAETYVNMGGVLLTMCEKGIKTINLDMSPIHFAKLAITIYSKYMENGGVDASMRYYQALQLYASSIYMLNRYEAEKVSKDNVLSLLRACLSWSRSTPGNGYKHIFEGVSGVILKQENWD